jgi:ubiquinone/menaquinone biosynthesis C-methylase UbiE
MTADTEYLRIEEDRIRTAYAKRTQDDPRYSWLDPAYLFFIQTRERCLLRLLRNHNISLRDKKIMEIGCGSGFLLREFIKWGARPANIVGVELLHDRVREAMSLCPTEVKIRQGNAAQLQFPDDEFDLVIQCSVFTSVLETRTRQLMAFEMRRVLKPGGLILWYDCYVNNPWNADVRGVKKGEIQRLFAGCRGELKRTTLAPAVARCLAPYSWLACYLLERIPWLCTHYLGVIRKNDE